MKWSPSASITWSVSGPLIAQLGQLAVEQGLIVEGIRDQLRGRDEPGRLVDADPVLARR